MSKVKTKTRPNLFLPLTNMREDESASNTFMLVDRKGGIVAVGLEEKPGEYIQRAANAYPALVAALKRLCNPNAECTCADGGEGFQCDVCQGRQALKDAGEGESG